MLLVGCTSGKTNEQPQEPEAPPVTILPAPEEPEAPTAETETIQLFFSKDEVPTPVEREVPKGADLLETAIYELVKGPTADEAAAGYWSWFSEETADVIQAITREGHVVIINFKEELPRLIPNASTSAGSSILISDLRETVFQFPEIEELELQLDGSCLAFGNWLQYGECLIIRR